MTDPYGISRAVWPWKTMDVQKHKPVQTYDSPEQMARCQECPYPDCVDCVGSRRADRAAQFMALYKSGLTDRQIAQAMGVTQPCIARRRYRHGLPPNWARLAGRSHETIANQ